MFFDVPVFKPFTVVFSLLLRMYKKSYCTPSSVGVGRGISKMLKFYVEVLCDGQSAVRYATLFSDRSCLINYQCSILLKI